MTTKKRSFFTNFESAPTDLDTLVVDRPITAQRCPNLFPRLSSANRIAIIGEAPGEAEVAHQIPFCPLPTVANPKAGSSGRLLNEKLSQANIVRDTCFIGNVCQFRPPSNDIKLFSRSGPEFTESLAQLKADLDQFNPNICILLGKTALWAANDTDDISSWRGSLFVSNVPGPFLGRKCIATYHPAYCLRMWEWVPILFFDLRKAAAEASSPDLVLPQRNIRVNLSYDEMINELDRILVMKPELSCDIEGWWNWLKCIGLAESPTEAIVIPFTHLDGSSYWEADQEFEIWFRFVRIMADPEIPKVWQNGIYDRWVLQYGYNVVVYGSRDDTMLKFWEMWCELPKGLAFQNSILNKEPYYKEERETESETVFLTYCGKDACTTYENNKRLDRLLNEGQRLHYRFNHSLITPFLYMELRGLRYNSVLAKERLETVNSYISKLQLELDSLAGYVNQPPSMDLVRGLMCDGEGNPRKGFKGKVKALEKAISRQSHDLPVLWREAVSINTKGPLFKHYLYEILNLPKQYKEDKDGVSHITTDDEALLRLSKTSDHPAIRLAIQIGSLRTRSQMLEIHADNDGRIRCGYNVVGTETGRLTCYTSPTGSGYNLTTIPDEDSLKPEDHPLHHGMRDLVLADPGCLLCNADLSGADGWTVGACLAALGDDTMLEDLKAGIKPAQRICYLLRHGNSSLAGLSRPEVKEKLKEVKKTDWDYFACKVGIWGTCYTMGPMKLSNTFLTESDGELYWPESPSKPGKVTAFQNTVKRTYNITLWHNHCQRLIRQGRPQPSLTAPNGFVRKFFGRWTELLGEYLAHLPQVITTYATNSALFKLWSDPENRVEMVLECQPITGRNKELVAHRLRIEPLHQVHDSLVTQWKIPDTDWAAGRLKSYFNNPVRIATQTLVIPFEGVYGTDWSMNEKAKKGVV